MPGIPYVAADNLELLALFALAIELICLPSEKSPCTLNKDIFNMVHVWLSWCSKRNSHEEDFTDVHTP